MNQRAFRVILISEPDVSTEEENIHLKILMTELLNQDLKSMKFFLKSKRNFDFNLSITTCYSYELNDPRKFNIYIYPKLTSTIFS
jgi:hypothetical protein